MKKRQQAGAEQPFAPDRWVIDGNRERVARLRAFAISLGSDEIRDQALNALPSALERAEQLAIRREEMANACEVSIPTIGRWLVGRTPHRAMARAALQALSKLAFVEADRIEAETFVRESQLRTQR